VSRDPTEIIQYAFQFAAQETFIITINVENSFAALYFCRNHDSQPFKSLG